MLIANADQLLYENTNQTAFNSVSFETRHLFVWL